MDVSGFRLVNDIAAFLVEMFMLWLLGVGGYRLPDGPDTLRWGIGVALPVFAIAFWSYKLAPRSKNRFGRLPLVVSKIALFIFAAFIGSYWSGVYAAYFVVMGILSALLEYAIGSNATTVGFGK